jgi:WD40 repeat protein
MLSIHAHRSLSGEALAVLQVRVDDLVATLKGAVAEAVSFRVDQFALLFGGERLKDWQTIRYIGLRSGDRVDIVILPETVMVTGSRESAKLWSLSDGSLKQTYLGHTGEIASVALSTDSTVVATGSWDRTLRVWDTDSGKCQLEIDCGAHVRSMCLSSSGNFIAASLIGKVNDTIGIWKASDGRQVNALAHEEFRLSCRTVGFSEDELFVISGHGNGAAVIWALDTKLPLVLNGHSGEINAARFSVDGAIALTGSRDWTARIWRADTGHCEHVLQSKSGNVSSVCFSSCASLVATGHSRGCAMLWRTATGELMWTYYSQLSEWYYGGVYSIQFAPDNESLITGEADGSARVWCLDTGECIMQFDHSDAAVRSISAAYRSYPQQVRLE